MEKERTIGGPVVVAVSLVGLTLVAYVVGYLLLGEVGPAPEGRPHRIRIYNHQFLEYGFAPAARVESAITGHIVTTAHYTGESVEYDVTEIAPSSDTLPSTIHWSVAE